MGTACDRRPGGIGPVASAEGPQPVGHVHEVALVAGYPPEQLTRPRHRAGPLVEVGQGVCPSEVVVTWPLGNGPSPFQEAQRLGDLPLVGQRTGCDQPALGHQGGAR